jgi:hypothetical protein
MKAADHVWVPSSSTGHEHRMARWIDWPLDSIQGRVRKRRNRADVAMQLCSKFGHG